MKDIDEIRRDNLRRLETECGSASATARMLDMSPSQFMNLRDGAKDSKTGKRRGMRKETARRIEMCAHKPPGWLDTPFDEPLSGRQIAMFQAQQTAEEQWLLVMWKSASAEAREVARFALSDTDAPLPGWADKDMRRDIDSMLYKALLWTRRGESTQMPAPVQVPKKIAVAS